ncbi:leucine-rich repeat domain-containing protein, partial [Mycoplasma marinum]|uniref:leucine-rich repeat domain-containing protein n=1 Tax=Mycoplasma marinum TaxID=1937190 RepID=UPI003B5142B7
ALINDSIKATKAFTDADRVSAYTPFPQTVIVAIGGHDITVTLTKGAADDDAGTIAWTASANVLNAGSTAVSKTGTLTGFSTKAKRETQKEDDILANLTAQEIETEIKKTTTLNSNTDPKDAQLDLTVKFVKDNVNVTAIIKKGTIDRLTGKADWSSIISTPNASAKRINLKGTIDNLLAKPLLEVERVINLNPTTTLTSQIGNKEIKQTGLADFGLTEKSLGINSLSSKISDIKITQDNYDFKNNKFKATITFNFQPDLKNSKKIKATYKLEIDGFKGPKITPADPTKISPTDFVGLQLPDDFTIPATVKTIEAGAFKGMKLNSSFQIPDTVTTIGANVFNNTEIPKGFKMPKAWSVIVGTSAFKYAKLPEGFVVPSTVKTINAGAFEETKMHPSFTVPDTIEHIESAAFKHDDSSLPKSFRLPTNPKFTTITSNQFQNTYLNDGFTIPKNVTSIGRQAFWSARLPIGFKVPASVSSIDYTAFGHSKLVAGAHVEDLNGKVIDWIHLDLSNKAWYARAGFVVVADKPATTSPSSSAPASPFPTKSQINYLTEEVFSNTLDSKKIYTDAK